MQPGPVGPPEGEPVPVRRSLADPPCLNIYGGIIFAVRPVATHLFSLLQAPLTTPEPRQPIVMCMSRAEAAPYPAALTHLRPADAAGLRVVGLATAGTALGLLLSFAGGAGMWICGQVLLAVMLVQWFVVLHECGHDTLFRTRRWHALVGRVAGAFALIPYACWKRVHGRHHKWTGWQDLDPTTAALVPRPLGRVERAIVNVCWRLLDSALLDPLPRRATTGTCRGCFACSPAPADRRRHRA